MVVLCCAPTSSQVIQTLAMLLVSPRVGLVFLARYEHSVFDVTLNLFRVFLIRNLLFDAVEGPL